MMKNALNQFYELPQSAIDFFQKNRYIKLKNVFDADILTFYGDKITQKVAALNNNGKPLDQRDTYGKAFVQIFNLWLQDDDIKDFVFSKRLGKIAADLMQTNGVRIYHDQALYKEGGGGITPWHADQYTGLSVPTRQLRLGFRFKKCLWTWDHSNSVRVATLLWMVENWRLAMTARQLFKKNCA